jgi:hypothetical protein
VHLPIEPATSHASHVPVHAVSQQRPSTQWSLTHPLALVQLSPIEPLSTHAPPLQWLLAAHCASVVHEVAQAPVPEHP